MSAQPFVKASSSILHSEMSDRAKVLFLLAKEHVWVTGRAEWSHAEMAAALHCSVSSARRAEKELRAAGLVTTEPAGPGQSNVLTVPEGVAEAEERRAANAAGSRVRRDPTPRRSEQGGSSPAAVPCSPVDAPSMGTDAYRCTTTTPERAVPAEGGPVEGDPVVVALQHAGIDPWTAGWLRRHYGADRCEKGLALLAAQKHIARPGAWLRRAIERDFAAPTPQVRPRAAAPRRSVEQIAAEEAEAARAKAAEEERQRRVLADIAARKARGEDWVAAYA